VSRPLRDAIPAPQRLFYMSPRLGSPSDTTLGTAVEAFPLPMGLASTARAALSPMQITRQPLLLVRDCHGRWKSDRIAVQGGEPNGDGDGAMPCLPSSLTLSKGQRKELKAMRLPAPQHLWPLSNTWSNPTNHRLVPYGHKPELRSSSTFTSHA
jgi:hypothetical protein